MIYTDLKRVTARGTISDTDFYKWARKELRVTNIGCVQKDPYFIFNIERRHASRLITAVMNKEKVQIVKKIGILNRFKKRGRLYWRKFKNAN